MKCDNYQQFGESEDLKIKLVSYIEIQKKQKFMKLYYASFEIIREIKDAFPLYFYMCKNITRRKGSYSWWNEVVLPYFHDGYLPFAKHNSHMAKELELTKTTIGRQLELLEKSELIVRLAEKD